MPEPEACSCRIAAILERNMIIRDAVLALDKPYRDVMLLFYWEDMTAPEIGSELCVCERTVRERLRTGRRLVRVMLAS